MASLAMVGQATAATYSSSKGAVSPGAVVWAAELAAHGVRVNGLFPLAHTRVTGQLIRFTANKIHIVRQVSAKEPVLRNDGWDVHDIAEAFDNHLLAVLETPTRSTVDSNPR